MKCEIIRAVDLCTDGNLCRFLRDHLTKPGSDFHKKLDDWAYGEPAHYADGSIAVVFDQGEAVGWARTEKWWEAAEFHWDTLEAFVAPAYRGLGISSWAASGIASGPLVDDGTVAVFHPTMLVVAKRARLHGVYFEKTTDGIWRRRP